MVADCKKHLIYGTTFLLVVAALIAVMTVPSSSPSSAEPPAAGAPADTADPAAEDPGAPTGAHAQSSQHPAGEAPASAGQNSTATKPVAGTKRKRRSRSGSAETSDSYQTSTETSGDSENPSRKPRKTTLTNFWPNSDVTRTYLTNEYVKQFVGTHYLFEFTEVADLCMLNGDLMSVIALGALDKLHTGNIEFLSKLNGVPDELKHIVQHLERLDMGQHLPKVAWGVIAGIATKDAETVNRYATTNDLYGGVERNDLLNALCRLIRYAFLCGYIQRAACVHDSIIGKMNTDKFSVKVQYLVRLTTCLVTEKNMAKYKDEATQLDTYAKRVQLFIRYGVKGIISSFITNPEEQCLPLRGMSKNPGINIFSVAMIDTILEESLSLSVNLANTFVRTNSVTKKPYVKITPPTDICMLMFTDKTFVAVSKECVHRLFHYDTQISEPTVIDGEI